MSQTAQDSSSSSGEWLELLVGDNPDDRLTAIQVLGEMGGRAELQALRDRLALVNKELSAVVAAVGKLKRKLGVK
jgi:hypothetical protein